MKFVRRESVMQDVPCQCAFMGELHIFLVFARCSYRLSESAIERVLSPRPHPAHLSLQGLGCVVEEVL